jgi:hypothetical protein
MSDLVKGQVREILSAAGAAVSAFGFATGAEIEAFSGLILSLVMLAWGLKHKSGAKAVVSLIRKVFGAGGAVLVVLEVLSPEKSLALVALVGPFLAMFSSFWTHGGRVGDVNFVWLGALFFVVGFLPGCGVSAEPGTDVRGPVSGIRYVTGEDGKLGARVDAITLGQWFLKVTRLAQGEDFKAVILTPEK